MARRDWSALDAQLALIRFFRSIEDTDRLRTSRTQKPGKSDDFTLVNHQIKRLYVSFLSESHRLDDDVLFAVFLLTLGILDRCQIIEILSHHLGNQLDSRKLRRRKLSYQLPIPKNGDLIADCIHLLQEMGNEYDADAFGFQAAHQIKELFYLPIIEGGGRLIKNQYLCRHIDCTGDRYHLLNCNRIIVDRLCYICMYVKVLQQFAGLFIHCFPVNQSAFSRFASDKQILCNRQVRTEIDFLIHGADAPVLCFLRAAVDDRMIAAVYHDFPCFKLLYTRQDFDQRGFSCAIFPHQGMNFAFF